MRELQFAAIVPARGGSTRVPRKNIALLGDKPLIQHTLDACVEADLYGAVFVSTEDAEIAATAARSPGVRVVERPAQLAANDSSTEDVLLHALDALASEGTSVEWVVTLPPTSPFRTGATIRSFLDSVRGDPDGQDCLMSVTENRGDFWRRRADGLLERLTPDAPRRQQDRAPLWEENSAIYVTRVSALRATRSILGTRVRGLPVSPLEGFDINTPYDLAVADAIVAHGGVARASITHA